MTKARVAPTQRRLQKRVVINRIPSTSTATLTGYLVVMARQGDSFSTVTRLFAKLRRVVYEPPLVEPAKHLVPLRTQVGYQPFAHQPFVAHPSA